MALDNNGHLFVAAIDENKVYRINLARGSISIVAGNGKECCHKDGMKATEVSLSLFLALKTRYAKLIPKPADSNNSRASRAVANKVLAEMVALPSTRASDLRRIDRLGPGRKSVDGGSGKLPDSRVDQETGTIDSLAVTGGTEQNCPPPHGSLGPVPSPDNLVLDTSGNIYFLEPAMNVVMLLDAKTGTLSTVAGNGGWGFSGDGDLASNAEISSPSGLAIDASGNLFVSDCRNKRIRRVDARTKKITAIAGNGCPHTIHAEM